VAAGVEIGAQCVVAANSFVNRSFPDGSIVGGTPAVELGRVREDGENIVLDYERPGSRPART
jgi:acetyltransferase-like isoleucine patch superfamily enzyme